MAPTLLRQVMIEHTLLPAVRRLTELPHQFRVVVLLLFGLHNVLQDANGVLLGTVVTAVAHLPLMLRQLRLLSGALSAEGSTHRVDDLYRPRLPTRPDAA